MVQARAVVQAVAAGCVSTPDELRKEGVASPTTVRDAGEARVLARHAHAGVTQHEHEEAGGGRGGGRNGGLAEEFWR